MITHHTRECFVTFNGIYSFLFTLSSLWKLPGVSAKLSVDFFVKKFSLLFENYFKVADKKWKHHFLKKVNKQLKSADIFFPILMQQKNGINEIALELSQKSGNIFFKALAWKKFPDFFPDPELDSFLNFWSKNVDKWYQASCQLNIAKKKFSEFAWFF